MKFSDVVKKILSSTSDPMTPQETRDQVKMKYPDFYGTPSHIRNVEKGHAKDIDHALLAQVYSLTGTSDIFHRNKSTKPMKIPLYGFERPAHRSTGGSEVAPIHITSYKRQFEYDDSVREIVSNAENYHDAYYFHERALATRHDPASLTHLEYAYAMRTILGTRQF